MKRNVTFLVVIFLLFGYCLSESAYADPHEEMNKLLQKNEFEKAEKLVQESIKKNNDAVSYCALGCLYRFKAKKSIVVSKLTEKQLAELQKKQGKEGIPVTPEDLQNMFENKEYIDPEIFSMAEAAYNKAIQIDKTYMNAYFNLLNAYLEMNRTTEFICVIDLMIKNLGNDKRLEEYLYHYGTSLHEADYLDEAIAVYHKTLRLFPDSFYTKSNLASAYIKNGKLDEAEPMLVDVIKKDPSDSINIFNIIRLYIFQENFNQADFYAEKLSEIKPHPYNYLLCGLIRLKTGKKENPCFVKLTEENSDIDKSLSDFAKKISRCSMDERADVLVKEIIANSEKDELMHFLYIQNLVETRHKGNAYLGLFEAYEKMAYFKKSCYYLDKAASYKEKGGASMDPLVTKRHYGRLYYKSGNFKKALENLGHLAEKNKFEPEVNYYLAMTYLKMGDQVSADKLLKINTEIDPSKADDKDNSKERYEYYISLSKDELKRLQSTKK